MIYMDNAATTAVCKSAREAMLPFLDGRYGNPSGGYELARKSKDAIENSRKIIARCIGAKTSEIFFTSGGTEADNWALTSIMMREGQGENPHMITSEIEHNAILNTCRYLEGNNIDVTYIPVDNGGKVITKKLEKSITDKTRLISIMYANNEVGTIQPIYDIGRLAKANNVLFHTDAVQAFGHIPINVKKMNIDLLSASGHKFGAPKGIGFLYVNENVDMEPLIFGGGQENGKRSGTENVPGIVAIGEATRYHHEQMQRLMKKEIYLREHMIRNIFNRIDGISINGHRRDRLPGNLSLNIDNVNGKMIVNMLDKEGICISAGSACATGKAKPSHVLLAMGLTKEQANGTVRITLSAENTIEEVNVFVEKLVRTVNYLRDTRE